MYGYGQPVFGGFQNSYAQNPYQMQAPTAPRVQTLAGRLVSSPDEITVQEVPGDGSVGWFPAHDLSCVYGKRWTADGTIQTVRFVPERVEQKSVDPIAELSGKVDAIMQAIEEMRGSCGGLSSNGAGNAAKKPAGARQPDAATDARRAAER